MSGDYTRSTFDPIKGFSSVLKQQGRVSLDWEHNENEEILDRRDRAEMYDTVGPAVYPLTTPDAFKIGVDGSGNLTIGQGRMYVDGILAECFGDLSQAKPLLFDARMNDVIGDDTVSELLYDDQPFHYAPPPPFVPAFPALSPTGGTINLVYLDVWQREVTVYEDAALREIALNGPDTAARMQTAWQVKVMAAAAFDDSCAKPPAAWTSLIAPSTGRLSAAAAGTVPAPGPCVISPAGGYTGLENRLYRVEIHDKGTVGGGATFKWSRDNASLCARVLSKTKVTLTDWILTVGSTGRDSWMRFEFGDHIELLDDDVEFARRESGTGGILAKVTAVNHATGEIHVDQDLTNFPIAADRHPRIKRWDIASATELFARPTNATAAIALENGITVQFGPTAADTLNAGDFWLFAARTADGSIDALDEAPPKDVLHHFAQLALVMSGSTPKVITDCRVPWPPSFGHEGCCSEVVQVGEDIQAAIDRLSGKGGCVCLKMGTHYIDEPLTISQSNFTIHGEVPWVTVRREQGGPAMLEITPPAQMGLSNVSVEGIHFIAEEGGESEAMITLEEVNGGRISECALELHAEQTAYASLSTGISLTKCDQYAIEHVQLSGFPFGIAGDNCHDVSVLDSRLYGPTSADGGVVGGIHHTIGSPFAGGGAPSGVAHGPSGTSGPGAFFGPGGGGPGVVFSLGVLGIDFEGQLFAGIYIERNIISAYQRGIQLGTIAPGSQVSLGGRGRVEDGCRIAANFIYRTEPEIQRVSSQTQMAFAIAAHVPRCEIVENGMNIVTAEQGGIIVVDGNMLVQRNDIRSTLAFDPTSPPDVIPVGVGVVQLGVDAIICLVRGNYFSGLQQAVLAVGAGRSGAAHRVDILENRIDGDPDLLQAARANILTVAGGADPVTAVLDALSLFSAIVVEELTHCRVADNEFNTAVCGVTAVLTLGVSITGNRVNDSLAGVVLIYGSEFDASDNIIDAGNSGSISFGIGSFLTSRSAIARNAISNCGMAIFTALNTATRLQDNDLYATNGGIQSIVDADLELRGNEIEDSTGTGISAIYSLHELTLAHDRVLRCGYAAPGAFSPDPAVGIEIELAIALVTVEGCHVIDTGESADATAAVFTGPRIGISVQHAIGARVRGCEIASVPLVAATGGQVGVNPLSRALWMSTLRPDEIIALLNVVGRSMVPFADATDNVIEQSVRTLVALLSYGELMFATNRCTNFSPDGLLPVVSMRAVDGVVTSNRVSSDKQPSMLIRYTHTLAAVGNSSTGPVLIQPPGGLQEKPSIYHDFNVVG